MNKWIGFALVMLFGAMLFILALLFLTPAEWDWYWKLAVIYFIPPAGKETVIPAGLGVASSLGVGVPLSPFFWGLTIWVLDLLACLIIITNWWILEFFIAHIPAFPFIGIQIRRKPRIYKTKVSLKVWYDKLHRKTEAIEKKKYGRILPIMLFVFMFIPFQGTGAMSTTIIGTWLGMRHRNILLTVALGSLLSVVFITLISLGILEVF